MDVSGSRKIGTKCKGAPVWDGDLSVTGDDKMLLRKKDSVFAGITDNLVSLSKELISSFPIKKEEVCLPHALPQAGRETGPYKEERRLIVFCLSTSQRAHK